MLGTVEFCQRAMIPWLASILEDYFWRTTHKSDRSGVKFRAFNGQYRLRIDANSNCGPACNNLRCSRSASKRVTLQRAGRSMGCLRSKLLGAAWSRPPTLMMPASSKKACNLCRELVVFNSPFSRESPSCGK